jgi:hypothetical protein
MWLVPPFTWMTRMYVVLFLLFSSTFICMSVSNLYIPRIGLHISCSRIGRSIMGLYKSLTGTWMCKLGLWPRNSFSWNIGFEFLVLVFAVCVNALIYSMHTVYNNDKGAISIAQYKWHCQCSDSHVQYGTVSTPNCTVYCTVYKDD